MLVDAGTGAGFTFADDEKIEQPSSPVARQSANNLRSMVRIEADIAGRSKRFVPRINEANALVA